METQNSAKNCIHAIPIAQYTQHTLNAHTKTLQRFFLSQYPMQSATLLSLAPSKLLPLFLVDFKIAIPNKYKYVKMSQTLHVCSILINLCFGILLHRNLINGLLCERDRKMLLDFHRLYGRKCCRLSRFAIFL